MLEILNETMMGKPLWMWGTFISIVIFLLALDLGVLHRKVKALSVKDSLQMSAFYVVIALAFGAWLWVELGAEKGEEYFTGYLIEKTLSIDNIFVISLIFASLAIPQKYQYRVLFWGILGVIVMRGFMIGLGSAVVENFHWVLYIFALFLIFTGFKMFMKKEEEKMEIEDNPVLKFLRRKMRITKELHDQRFVVKQKDEATGKMKLFATPLLIALIMVELIDLVFAVDSIPAIFAITTDPYIVYTSNIFAILGLRALYFALSAIIDRFEYLQQAMAAVLVFIGSKIFITDLMGWEKFPASWSLGITVSLLAFGIVYSLYKTRDVK